MAILFASFAFWKKAREEHYEEEQVIDMILLTLLFGLVGARLVHIILNFGEFGLNIFYYLSLFSKPGYSWIGFYLGALYVLVRQSNLHKYDIFKTLDMAVIGLSLAKALLNLAVFLSGSAQGLVTKLPVGVVFPNTYEPRHPLGLYGFLLWLVVFVILWKLEGKYRRFVWYQKYKGDSLPGFLFFAYLIASGIIGSALSLLSQSNNFVLGINIDLMFRLSILLIGLISLLARSGLGAKLGLDNIAWLGKK